MSKVVSKFFHSCVNTNRSGDCKIAYTLNVFACTMDLCLAAGLLPPGRALRAEINVGFYVFANQMQFFGASDNSVDLNARFQGIIHL